jgi:hypothetical protein
MTTNRRFAAKQSGTAARPVALFVLGFGRSGTSALTRVLSLCGAALWDGSALDRVFGAYRVSEHGFRTAFEDANRYLRADRFMLPSLVKLALEGLAIAHRRRGTWA